MADRVITCTNCSNKFHLPEGFDLPHARCTQCRGIIDLGAQAKPPAANASTKTRNDIHTLHWFLAFLCPVGSAGMGVYRGSAVGGWQAQLFFFEGLFSGFLYFAMLAGLATFLGYMRSISETLNRIESRPDKHPQ